MVTLDITKYVRKHPEYSTALVTSGAVATYRCEVVAFDDTPEVVDVLIPVVRRVDGALISPLFYSKAWVVSVIQNSYEFKKTVQFDAKSTSMVNDVLGSVEKNVESAGKLDIASAIGILPSLKAGIRCELVVKEVTYAGEVSEAERAFVDSLVNDVVEFSASLISQDALMQPAVLMRLIGVANKAGLGDAMSSLMGMAGSKRELSGSTPTFNI